MAVRALYWLTHDLRLRDNAIFHQVRDHGDSLLCVYFIEPQWQAFNRYQLKSMGRSDIGFCSNLYKHFIPTLPP